MNDAMDDTKLTALLAGDRPPASDPRFVLAVMTRIEQRRFRRDVAITVGLGACAVVLLALLAPTMEIAWHDSFAPYANNLAILLVLAGITLAVPHFFPARND
jgi:hypothetical protein